MFDPVEIVLTGGEPLASDLFVPFVAELAGRGLSYRFVTNGWLIPRALPALRAHPPRFVRVSLSGATPRTHDGQRGRGSFQRALLGAAALMARGIRAELSMVVTRESRPELEAAIHLASSLGVAELHFILPQPTPETAAADLDLAPTEWDATEREVSLLARAAPLPVVLDYGAATPMPRGRCRTLSLFQLYVDARGRVPFCCQLSRYGTGSEVIIGDLRRETLRTVVARAQRRYDAFVGETVQLHRRGELDALDAYPCLSCARRHGRTGFLADHPSHPWVRLARPA